MKAISRSVLAILLVTFALAAHAKPPYLSDEKAAELAILLPDPPGENCPETKAELNLIVDCQKHCTPQKAAEIGLEGWISAVNFQDALGPWFNEENLPQTMQLLRKVNLEAKHCCDIAKQHFDRRRPRFLDARIQPVFLKVDEPCYPSGHALQATALAVILTELAPDRRKVLMERAWEIGWNRIPAGLHYPSDCTAGRVLGLAVARTLLADPGFQAELAKVKQEFATVKQDHYDPIGTKYR